MQENRYIIIYMCTVHRVHILCHRPGDPKTQGILMRKNPEPLTRALHILLQAAHSFFPITLRSFLSLGRLVSFRHTIVRRYQRDVM